ncbi:MAG: hypothetical protein LBL46_03600 [Rickettsiales bacterium]|jgi:hypothetical protein|nr:hypothetical protein [Rickettsiales bacterium]
MKKLIAAAAAILLPGVSFADCMAGIPVSDRMEYSMLEGADAIRFYYSMLSDGGREKYDREMSAPYDANRTRSNCGAIAGVPPNQWPAASRDCYGETIIGGICVGDPGRSDGGVPPVPAPKPSAPPPPSGGQGAPAISSHPDGYIALLDSVLEDASASANSRIAYLRKICVDFGAQTDRHLAFLANPEMAKYLSAEDIAHFKEKISEFRQYADGGHCDGDDIKTVLSIAYYFAGIVDHMAGRLK